MGVCLKESAPGRGKKESRVNQQRRTKLQLKGKNQSFEDFIAGGTAQELRGGHP